MRNTAQRLGLRQRQIVRFMYRNRSPVSVGTLADRLGMHSGNAYKRIVSLCYQAMITRTGEDEKAGKRIPLYSLTTRGIEWGKHDRILRGLSCLKQ